MYTDRGLTSDGAIALMAVAAVVLAIALASSLDGGGETDTRPDASFVFDRDGSAVVVTHFGGDAGRPGLSPGTTRPRDAFDPSDRWVARAPAARRDVT